MNYDRIFFVTLGLLFPSIFVFSAHVCAFLVMKCIVVDVFCFHYCMSLVLRGPLYSVNSTLCVCSINSWFGPSEYEEKKTGIITPLCPGGILMLSIHTCPFVATGEEWLFRQQSHEALNHHHTASSVWWKGELNQVTKVRQSNIKMIILQGKGGGDTSVFPCPKHTHITNLFV